MNAGYRACVAAIGGVLMATSPAAWAQPSTSPEVPLAEALFREGRALMEAGRFVDACPKLAESQRLDPALGTLLNLAGCHELEGRTGSAWAEFLDAAALAQRAGRSDREKTARERAAALEKRLHRLSLKSERVPGMEVRLDGQRLGNGAFGTPFPIDPGEHVLEAHADGRQPYSKRFVARAGPALTEMEVALEPVSSEAKPSVPRRRSPSVLGFVVGGLGVASIGLGSYLGLRAFAKKRDGDPYCAGTGCTQTGLDLHSEARTSATISTIAFGVGLVALGCATYLLVFAPKASED